ncbi:MAG: glycosyltransferase family 2 protein [Gammaproteobacteria bacterium]
MSAGSPLVSVVTPSFNQGDYLPACLDSVHGQSYPAIEHLVYDGGSDDDSAAIIEARATAIAYWQSEPDGGQTRAINAGLERATGDILCWLNSDDGFMPGALAEVARLLPLDRPAWLVGSAESRDARGRRQKVRRVTAVDATTFVRYKEFWIPQPSVFWNRAMQDAIGLLDENLNYIMDLDFFFRMLRQAGPLVVGQTFSFYTVHPEAKTSAEAGGVDDEYAAWMCRRVAAGEFELEDVLRQFVAQQRAVRTYHEHVVLSRIARLWKRYVNPRLPI